MRAPFGLQAGAYPTGKMRSAPTWMPASAKASVTSGCTGTPDYDLSRDQDELAQTEPRGLDGGSAAHRVPLARGAHLEEPRLEANRRDALRPRRWGADVSVPLPPRHRGVADRRRRDADAASARRLGPA